jgi:hypothetical protein
LVFLNWEKVTVLFLDKEYLQEIGRVRWFDLLLESFFQYLIYCILFLEGHGVGFALEGLGGIGSEGDNMVPFAMGGSRLASFLLNTLAWW